MADNNDIKTQAMASDLEVKEVTALDKVERMLDDDVLLLIRQISDGSQKCFKVRGYDFHGEDAYVIAKNHGFEGTYEDWQAAVNKVVDVQPLADNLTEVTKKAEKATADAISETDAVKLIAEQVSAAEAIRVANETERQSNEEARAEAETERESNEEARATQEGVRQDNETARENAEANRVTAEEKREAGFSAAKDAADKATESANSMASHPPYVDADGYYYKWNVGTQTYDKTDVNLVGKPFAIKKVFPSVADMEATDVNTFAENDFLLINTADVEDADNAKLYVVALNEQGEKFYSYLVDLSGFRGFTGKTPQLTIGTITTLEDGEEAAASLTYDGVDNDGNPKYKINFGIPKGKSFTFADFTEEQLEELKKPATDAANEAKAQTALCEAATAAANEAADASNAQTSLCEAATNSAQDILTRFGELVAAINIEVVGDGNAIASVSQTDSKLTFTKGSFLPLSGGTLTGDHEFLLEINSSNSYDFNYIRFVKNSTGKATATVGYYRNMAFIANESNSAPRIGVTDDGTPQYWTNFRGDTKYNLIHSGNIGQQSVANATRAVTLEGYHETDFHHIVGRYRFSSNGTAPYNYIHLCRIGNSSGYSTLDFEIDFRGRYYSAKIEIRITTGSVAYGTSNISIVKKVISGRSCGIWYVQTKNSSGYDYYDIYCKGEAWDSGSYEIINRGAGGILEFTSIASYVNSVPDGNVEVKNFTENINGDVTIDGRQYFRYGDSTLRFWGTTTGNDEKVYIQTGIDNRTDDYNVPNYGGVSKHRLVFQPNGGRVGICDSSPAYTLEVGNGNGGEGTCRIANKLMVATSDKSAAFNIAGDINGVNSIFKIGANINNASDNCPWYGLRLGSTSPVMLSGYFGVTIRTEQSSLQITSNKNMVFNGTFSTSGDITGFSSSDRRLKKNIHSLDCLGIIKHMGGTVGFEWKKDGKSSIGWIAQRVQKNLYMRDLVATGDNGFLKINYWSPKLIAVAFGAIEQVDSEVNRLKKKVAKLEATVKTLRRNRL